MDKRHPALWHSVLEEVKPHIPTNDCDSSSSENEEIMTIYERPAGLSLNVPEDVDDFLISSRTHELEELSKPVAQTCGSEETEVTTALQRCTQHYDTDVEAEACESCPHLVSAKANVDNTKSKDGSPVLSFERLDWWNLDDVLQSLKEDGLSLQRKGSLEHVKRDGDKDRSQGDIMQRLITFCNSQLSKSVPAAVNSPNSIRQNKVWNTPSVRMAALRTHQECPTVFIDLRYPEPSLKLPRNLTSESKHNNAQQDKPHAKKPNLKAHTGSQTGDREMTGKSTLLQKIREMNRTGDKYSSKHINTPYSLPGNKGEEQKEKLPKPGSTCSLESQHLRDNKQSSHAQFEYRNPKTEKPPIAQQSTIETPKQQSDQQRQDFKQTSQHDKRQQILKQLKIHRPTKSVSQKQQAAERTEVLYDLEASHLQSISPLPADIKSKGCMLLIVSLSSPGMIGDRRHRKRKHLYPAATKSHIYHTLVSWFLSLVGQDPCHDEDEAGAGVPFWVAGLQQLWTEDGLALHVLAVARHGYKKRDTHAPFYNHVYRFLSKTSLTVIADQKVQQIHPSPIQLPSSPLNCFISATSNRKVIDRTFVLSPGFYWQTVETQEHVCRGRETTQELHTEVSVGLWFKAFFLHPPMTHYTLQLILHSGLDVCGLRLLYPPPGLLSDSTGAVPVIQRSDDTCEPVLALAVRGPHANSVFKDLTGSLDLLLPRKTDCLNPLQHRHQEPPLFYSPSIQVHRELCLWFSGRLPGGSHNWHLNRLLSLDDRGSLTRSPSFLCATTKADLLLVVSPVVPPRGYGQVLAVCERRGFRLRGLQRLQLQTDAAAVLGLTNQQALVFCSPLTVTLDKLEVHSHCLLLLLRKENAMNHSIHLPAALMREFKAQKLLGVHSVEPSSCFHTVCYSSILFSIFVRCMWAVPDPSSVILSHHKSTSRMEQVVILTLRGKDMSQGLSLLHRVLTEGPEGFELLGLKCLPALTRLQAQELSPYEVGEQLYPDSLDNLMSSPALVCALRQADAFASLRKLLPHDYRGNLCVLMSPTPEVAFRQASLFFFEHEMIPDHRNPALLQFQPKNCSPKGCSDPQKLLTVCLFKRRIWNHSLAKIVNKLQLSGLALVGLRVLTLDNRNATSLLPAESDPSDSEACVECLCSGSSLALCLEGENAVRRLLDVLCHEESSLQTASYASGSYETAIQDVKRLFPEGLCCIETSIMRQEQILSLCSDPLASLEREQSCTVVCEAQNGLSPSSTSGPNGGPLLHNALWQTTCLLIPFNAPPLSQVPSELDMLEQLLRSGCHLVAGRMSMLDNEQRKHIAGTLTRSSSRVNERVPRLSSAHYFIMALKGEMVVSGFKTILESIYKERTELDKVGETIIYPESEKEAKQLICYLFDAFVL